MKIFPIFHPRDYLITFSLELSSFYLHNPIAIGKSIHAVKIEMGGIAIIYSTLTTVSICGACLFMVVSTPAFKVI
jgi:hypothetical protein